ncbi:MAG TPA: glycosyltransferase family 2 protein [Myxococcales bacterium]|nr:glycosyltransferase family 2 protein [Myxococcales bacterium]
MATVVFWGAALLLLHTYFFYPLALFALDGWQQVLRNVRFMQKGRDGRRAGTADDAHLPAVTLVVAAHDEAACMAAKLANSLGLDYPADRFDVVIGSDGSTDGTDGIVAGCGDPRVHLSAAPRAGKAAVLNRCVPVARGEIVVFSDANTMIDPPAVRRLVRHFEDPEVGAVCGRLRLFNRTRREYEESAYWAYESLIKMYEGKFGSVMGVNGGLYAIRRSLFTALPPGTIVDDLVIALRILENGYQVRYDPEAVAHEETTEDYDGEFGRRARIAAGNFQSLRVVPGLLSPSAGFRAFAFWSHKVLRWCAPALMALAFVANCFLVRAAGYRVLLAAQLLFYGLAAAGRAEWFDGQLRRAASVAYYFVKMNAAIAVGFWRFLRGSQAPAWERTARA